ncbi:MAG: ATP phosphoribosyltransferase regulatory subunit [Eggerthellaceae bacterium]|nr:ATP phosphoribosyltransferase regulatory subunit [Eggerthellaceae bacterium]
MEYTTPSGFRDVLADEAAERERIARRVADLFASRGYVPIETPTLESMAVMQAGGRVPASPFKFFDATGDLVTMRPDVTLQVARICATRLGDAPGPFKFRYMQRVFRETEGQLRADVREKKQIGIECVGEAGAQADAEVIGLFAQALEAAGVADFKLSLATVGVLRALLAASTAPESWKADLLEAFHTSNFVEIDALCDRAEGKGSQFAPVIRELARIRGGREAIAKARELVAPFGCADALDSFEEVYDLVAADGLGERIVIDFSVMSSFDYYTGIVFEAFAPGLGTSVGSGGRYDKLLATYGVDRPAAGFAFYLEEAMEAAAAQVEQVASERPLRVAVPKGSLNADSIAALAEAGLDVTGLDDPGRSLIISNPGVDYIIVRPSDAPIFVEMGAADCGICGEDSLLETDSDVVELADLRFGACRFIVAEPEGAAERTAEHYRQLGSIRVATKYPRIARAHFARRGTQVEIVQLHGNIELGPLTGMSECIVDITATGTTLRENNLVITDEVLSSTARFFANVASFRTDARVRDLAEKLREQSADCALKVTAGGAGKQNE